MSVFNINDVEALDDSFTYIETKLFGDNGYSEESKMLEDNEYMVYGKNYRTADLVNRDDLNCITPSNNIEVYLNDISRSLALLCDLKNEEIIALSELFVLIRDKEFRNEYYD